MSKQQKEKAPIVEEEPEVEIVTKVEYTYKDTKCIVGIEPEVPDIGFEEETIYANIERSALMKIATRPDIFACSKVIGWILPREDVTTMIL